MKALLNLWKRPICWFKGHDVIAGDNLFWYDCQRCWKDGVGEEALRRVRP